jgi:hypothetical protein
MTEQAADAMALTKTIARYGSVDLLCIDELGYLKLDRRGAELLFQVLTEREEKNSVAIASNESLTGWGKTFTDLRLWCHRRLPHLRKQPHRYPHHTVTRIRDWLADHRRLRPLSRPKEPRPTLPRRSASSSPAPAGYFDRRGQMVLR